MIDSLHFTKRNVVRQHPKAVACKRFAHDSDVVLQSEFPELVCVIGGEIHLVVGSERIAATQGSIIAINGGVEHSFDAKRGEGITIAFRDIHLGDLNENLIIQEGDYMVTHISEAKELPTYFKDFWYETEHKNAYGKMVCDYLARVIFMLCMRGVVFDMSGTLARNLVFAQSKEYFDQHFMEIDSLDAYCKQFDINKFYLTHLFKENLHIPPIKYITSLRIERAKKMLRETNLSISAISKDCAYEDTAYFCRVFKKSEGCTPLHYRSRINK